MNFYNIVENSYIEKKQTEFLISKYNIYLLLIFIYGFIIGSYNLYSINSINEKKYYIYLILFVNNINFVIFYMLNLFKNYYKFYKKKNNVKSTIFELFISANVYSFVIQNSFIVKEGNDFLSINSIFSILDFLHFIFEFIIIDLIKESEKKTFILNIISFIVSLSVQIILLSIITIFLVYFFNCKCANKKKIENFLKYF